MVDHKNKTIQKWQQQIWTRLLLWKDKLIQSGTEIAYGTLCAVALFPALEAAQQGDFSLLTLLMTDFGVNLIAHQIQAVKDAGEADAPRLLQSQAEENPEIRVELDRILQKLDVIELARGSMKEEERATFFEQLKENLPQGSTLRLGKRSVFVKGDLCYSIINTGDGVRINYYGEGSIHKEIHNHPQDLVEVAEREKQQKLSQYLDALIYECQIVPFMPVGAGTTGDIEITLDQIYIDLDVHIPIKKGEIDRVPALKITTDTDRLVLLGDPGSGKSTFVKMVARSAALDWMENNPPALGKQLIPVILILRELVEDLQSLDPENVDEEQVLSQFKTKTTETLRRYGISGFKNDFLRFLKDQPALFIFDGMDEVPQNLRKAARLWVETVIRHLQPKKAILTCRIRSYFDEAVIRGYKAFTLAPFNEKQIQNFTLAWYRSKKELKNKKEVVKTQAQDFFDRIRGDDNIFEMASNPLLLTQMAVLHQRDTRLPEQRAELYEEIIQLLLTRWQEHSGAHFKMSEDLANLLKKGSLVRLALEHLAFTSHHAAKDEKKAADLPRHVALEILNGYFKSYGLAEEFLRYLDQRSGLLQGRGGTIRQADTYTFPHRTFQEYLAGCYINRQSQHAKLRLLAEIACEGDYWDDVFQLSIEERVHIGKNPDLVELAAQMCNFCDQASENGHRMIYWSARLEQLLGEEHIHEYDDPENNIITGRLYLSDLQEKLLPVATGIKLTPMERADAADALDCLGYVPQDLYTFVEIPGDEETPTFWIGRYPVSNLQYARFLTTENFADQSLWLDMPDYDEKGQFRGTLGDEACRWMQSVIGDEEVLYPRYWGSLRFGIKRRCAPVVGISWYEAMAYGCWLQRSWDTLIEAEQNNGLKPNLIRLPVEAEWEKAVGGTEGDRYAWNAPGDTSDRERLVKCANIRESGIGRTTPVWTYPQGQSCPHGLFDMSGNVWEWQANRYEAVSGYRGLRGGSFHNLQYFARCAYRSWFYPDDWDDHVGFRLCLRP